MYATEFEKQKEMLIRDIISEIKEEKDLEALIRQFNRVTKRNVRTRKKAPLRPDMRFKESAIKSLDSMKNVLHEEAVKEIDEMVEVWK